VEPPVLTCCPIPMCSGTSTVWLSLSLVGLFPSLKGLPAASDCAFFKAACSFLLGRRFLELGRRFLGRGVLSSGMGGTGIADAADAAKRPVSSALSFRGRIARGRSFLPPFDVDAERSSSRSFPSGAFKQVWNGTHHQPGSFPSV